MCIGPAGENLSLIAAIMNEHRAAGRSGVGAVMGSKNLKALVIRGVGRKAKIADPEAFSEVIKRCRKKIKDSPATGMGLPNLGTAMCVTPVNGAGAIPSKMAVNLSWRTTAWLTEIRWPQNTWLSRVVPL